MKDYIYNDLTGYRKLQGVDDSDVWARIVTDDNLIISLDPVAYDKSELREWLLNANFSHIKPTLYDGLYQIS
jgi:hypothetical protein